MKVLSDINLHETAHFAMVQQQSNADMYSTSGPGGVTRTEAERFTHEAEANSIAKAIAQLLGVQTFDRIPSDTYAPGVDIIFPGPPLSYEPFYPPLPSLPDNDFR